MMIDRRLVARLQRLKPGELLALTQHRQWTIVENISASGKSRFSVRRAA